MANTISTEVKIAAAKEVFLIEQTGKTKKQIAEEFNISSRSLNRYYDQYKDEIESEFSLAPSEEVEQIESVFEAKEEKEPMNDDFEDPNYTKIKNMDHYESLSIDQKVILEKYYATKKLNLEYVPRPHKLGRTPKGFKSSNDVVLEIIESHVFDGTMTKENRDAIAKEICEKVGHERGDGHSKWLLSKFKKLFGANRLK